MNVVKFSELLINSMLEGWFN